MPKDPRIKGKVRRSQLITTYGTGAIVALGDESFMVAGIDQWPTGRPNIQEPRLEQLLRVNGFVLPPAEEDRPNIPVVRFPEIHSCPTCKRLDKFWFFAADNEHVCSNCNTPLVPSRFIVACANGHVDDFPYFEWVHAQARMPQDGSKKHSLRIEAGGKSTSLSDIVISCTCGASATMEGSFGKEAMRGVKRCTGKRPWLSGEAETCTGSPRTLQRGASNGYFSVVRSSISIPPWSEGAFKLMNRHWDLIRHLPPDALAATLTGMGITEGTPYTVDELVTVARKRLQAEQDFVEEETAHHRLRKEEYEALTHGMPELSSDQDFVCTKVENPTDFLGKWFDLVAQVKRLREVRVLESFTRLLPPSPADRPERRAALSLSPMSWLPAIEVIGEGVFLRIDSERLRAWERNPTVVARAAKINHKYVERFERRGAAPDRVISPRLMLIHTLSHVMIAQFALEAGYPAASLRERLYVADDMEGLLIYTATTDAAGSLGGVVAEAEPVRLEASFRDAIAKTAWCSADPLCIETVATGVDSLNLAACHACVLLPEVSCEEQNVLLDRGLLVGTPENPELGFFSSLL